MTTGCATSHKYKTHHTEETTVHISDGICNERQLIGCFYLHVLIHLRDSVWQKQPQKCNLGSYGINLKKQLRFMDIRTEHYNPLPYICGFSYLTSWLITFLVNWRTITSNIFRLITEAHKTGVGKSKCTWLLFWSW